MLRTGARLSKNEVELDTVLLNAFRRTGGDLVAWVRPETPPLLGEEYASALARRKVQQDSLLAEIREELCSGRDVGLELNFDEDGLAVDDLTKKWQSGFKVRVNELVKNLSIWTSAGLGDPKLLAEYAHWSQMAFLQLEEALWLSVGLEPQAIFSATLNDKKIHTDLEVQIVAFLKRRQELLRREFNPNRYESRHGAKAIKAWIERVSLAVHPEFYQMLEVMVGRALPTEQTSTKPIIPTAMEGERFDNRERTSLAKLIVSMAMDFYGYVPSDARSPIPAEIQGYAAKQGIDIDVDTVRKYLKLGATYLPKD